MQLEWSRFLEGISTFKKEQGMLGIICVICLAVLWQKGTREHRRLWISSIVLGVCVLCPVTALVLLKLYTPFYHWLDLLELFPMMLIVGMFGTELFFSLKKLEIPRLSLGKNGKTIVSGICLVIIFLTATCFHGFDRKPEAVDGVPAEMAEVFTALNEAVGEKEVVLAAPAQMLQYSRLFNPDWHPVYGRDLWSGKSASYINSAYDSEYQYYSLLGSGELSQEAYAELTFLINEGRVDCVIIPGFWLTNMGEMPEYEIAALGDFYIGIIKKDLITT